MHSLPLLPSKMAAAAARIAVKQVIKPHIPLIKFPVRIPGVKPQAEAGKAKTDSYGSSVSREVTDKPSISSGTKGQKVSTIESSELPQKYRRKHLTNEEIEIIEKGGTV